MSVILAALHWHMDHFSRPNFMIHMIRLIHLIQFSQLTHVLREAQHVFAGSLHFLVLDAELCPGALKRDVGDIGLASLLLDGLAQDG